jgi:hypothetical protein
MIQSVLIPPGTTLFHVSAQYLGTPTQWYRIAQINGIKDPLVRTPMIITVPPKRLHSRQEPWGA